MRRAVECVVVAVCLLMMVTGGATTTVFNDTLAPPFLDWSWAVVNKSYTTNVHSGSKAISFLPIDGQSLYFRATNYIDTAYFTGLQFWAYRPAAASENVWFALVTESQGSGIATAGIRYLTDFMVGYTWPANTWIKVYLNFSNWNPGVYDGFWIEDDSGSSSSTVPLIIFDDFVLTNSALPPPAVPTQAPTPAPLSSNIDAQVAALYTTTTVGQASYSGYTNNAGSCGLYPSPGSDSYPVLYEVSIGNYMNSKTCGMCLQVSGWTSPPYSRMVFVNNQYRSAVGNLAIQASGNGAFNMSYKGVPCPVTAGIVYLLKATCGPRYVAIMPQGTVYPVYKFGILVAGKWVYLTRQSNNLFVTSFSQNVNFPYQVQLTSVKGEVITDVIENTNPWGTIWGTETEVGGDAQFTP